MLSSDHDGTIICGVRKKGKSTLTAHLYRNEPRVILYDAKGELTEPLRLRAGETNPALWRDKGILRAYVAREGDNLANELEWSAFLAIQMGNCVYVVDELPDALEDRDPGQSWKWVTRMGRKKDIRFIYTFQRAAEVPRMATANASDWYLFQTNEGADLNRIRESLGKEASEIVRCLRPHSYLHCRDGRILAEGTTDKP